MAVVLVSFLSFNNHTLCCYCLDGLWFFCLVHNFLFGSWKSERELERKCFEMLNQGSHY